MQTGDSTGLSLAATPAVLTRHGPGHRDLTAHHGPHVQPPAPQRPGPASVRSTITVSVFGCDRRSEAAVLSHLHDCPGLELVPEAALAGADVTVVAAETLDGSSLPALRAVRRSGARRTLLVAGEVDARGVADAIDAGVTGILRLPAVTTPSLCRAIGSAHAGESVLPTELLTPLMGVARSPRQRPAGRLDVPGPQTHSERELAVLRMLGEGSDTREIARRLAYSERTVKTVIQEMSQRVGLRNRSHAVAYAVRNGLI